MIDRPEELNLTEIHRDLEAYTAGPLQTDAEWDTGLRCRLLMALPLLVDHIDRLTRERDSLRADVRRMESIPTVEQLTPAISDPGSVVGRDGCDSHRPESVSRWFARSVVKAVQDRWRHDVRE